MITECASVQLDALLEAGGDRELIMARLLMPPEEWELLRPTAWTPSDGVSLARYRIVARDVVTGVYPIADIDALRVYEAAGDGREGCTQGDLTDEFLFVRPLPRQWTWHFGPEGSFGGENGGGYWLDVRRPDLEVNEFGDAVMDDGLSELQRRVLGGLGIPAAMLLP